MTTQSPSAKAVVRSSLVQRLSRFVSLSSAEIEVLEDLQSTTAWFGTTGKSSPRDVDRWAAGDD